ncbi:MAG: hypothetical protein JWN44_5350 [Myxococcales bacterium]|nr:hypothetical protein [Myxococcales bacterium]
MSWLFVGAFVLLLVVMLLATRTTAPPTPALKLAGGPPDDAADAAAGRPLLSAIVAALRVQGIEVSDIEPEDWGYTAAATLAGKPLLLRLGAHGSNGVGRIWLLVLEGASPTAARTIERAVIAVAGIKVLGWDD